MISPIPTGYQFLIVYKQQDQEIRRFAFIPYSFVATSIDKLIGPVLQAAGIRLKEAWFMLIPEPGITPGELRRPQSPGAGFHGEEGSDRPARFSSLVLPGPGAAIQWLRLEVNEMNEMIYSCHLSVEELFMYFIDKVAALAYGPGLKSGSIVYYELMLSRDDNAAFSDPDGDATLVVPETFSGKDVFELPRLKSDRTRISFSKVKSDVLPLYTPSGPSGAQTRGRGRYAESRVVLTPDVYHQLVETLPLSQSEENGGYLVGNAYRQAEGPENEEEKGFRWIIEITAIVPAEHAFGNSLLLLFTSETWSKLNQAISRDFPTQKLLGWYHTHLFAASDSFGLSELDQSLHRQFFTKPWQAALLLNIDKTGRELRCFQKNDSNGRLEETKYEVYV
ncbi:hypothetical protein Q4E93_20930 [Flavitalea sp. BT771]|uniref:hypothetical protein n=1 Tax=Flavitalea sp. BT771 TaxID=3063329 RepID=UPI0026E21F80|nr:hypothetical protein [Flavitalea sp. BT771]MDO6433086.1 hypothetical protein [Flavitalea sp. BT771]MDV6221638.1 hypothetical protein [Flavitalea sp. BT771]